MQPAARLRRTFPLQAFHFRVTQFLRISSARPDSSTFSSNNINEFQFSRTTKLIIISNRGTNPDLIPQINADIPKAFPLDNKQEEDQHPHLVFWGGGGYTELWHIAPWQNRQDLYVWK